MLRDVRHEAAPVDPRPARTRPSPAQASPARGTIRAAGQGPGGGGGGGGEPGGGDPRRQGNLATQERRETKRPPRFKVLLYNDDYTPMEFVVALLERVFGKGPSAATAIMLKIHNSGHGVAGVYTLEIAETKVATVHRLAEERGYPLRAGVEKE